MGGPAVIDGKSHTECDNFQVHPRFWLLLFSLNFFKKKKKKQPVEFKVDNVTYYSAENYFQCAKATNETDREKVRKSGTGGDVWMAGRRITMRYISPAGDLLFVCLSVCVFVYLYNHRKDWEVVKVREMLKGNEAKFAQHPDLAQALIATKGNVSFYASSAFWCKWNGLIMELIRAVCLTIHMLLFPWVFIRSIHRKYAKMAKQMQLMLKQLEIK